jgi:endo-1,4-beta-D-glucanase Y
MRSERRIPPVLLVLITLLGFHLGCTQAEALPRKADPAGIDSVGANIKFDPAPSFHNNVSADLFLPMSVSHNPVYIQLAWDAWKTRQIISRRAGPPPRQRVLGGVTGTTTVSEGQAYGMLFAVLFNEQHIFDGLWLFAADHLNDRGLMHWHIGDYQEILGAGAATDGDVDMALALVYACYRERAGTWPASPNGLDYCALAMEIINAIWEYEVDHPGPGPQAGLDDNPGYELLPGDTWNLRNSYPDGVVNLSYFSPGYFRVFAEFTGNPDWYRVIERNYEIAGLVQSQPGNCSGLVPNWNTYDGRVQEVRRYRNISDYWGWDAARFAWRVAVDAAWYDAPQAHEHLNRIGGFFSSIGFDNLRGEYRLDGFPADGSLTPFFRANAAAAIWAAPNPIPTDCGQASGRLQTDAQSAYESVVAHQRGDYYNDAWRLLAMLLMTGGFPRPDQLEIAAARPASTPTDTATPAIPALTTFDPSAQFLVEIQGNRNADEQQSAFRYRLINTGDTTQSGISIRFYFTRDGALKPDDYILEMYWDQSEAATVSGPIHVDGDVYYFLIDYGGARLNPGASWEYHGTLRLRNWIRELNTGNDWWKTGGLSSHFQPTTSLPVYIDGNLAAGNAP